MKYTLIILLMTWASVCSFAQKNIETIEFRVEGNCGMCKERIESALDAKGVKSAQWDKKSKMVRVVYVPGKITEMKLHELIAEAGHDTCKLKAKDEDYKKLDGCCHYRDDVQDGMKDH